MRTFSGLLVAAFALAAPGAHAQPAAPDAPQAARPRAGKAPQPPRLDLSNAPRSGDVDAMRERRTIRMPVPYSRTLYRNDQGVERGLAAELARDVERYLNRRHAAALGKRPLTVVPIVTTRDELLPHLAGGSATSPPAPRR